MKNGDVVRARNVYERAVEKLADDVKAEKLFVAFAEFEEQCKETERARCIYKLALDRIPKGRAEAFFGVDTTQLLCMDQVCRVRDSALGDAQRARAIYELAISQLELDKPELLWKAYLDLEQLSEFELNMEASFGDLGDISLVQSKLPKKVKKKRPIETEDGPAGYEEYIDYLFPEASETTNLKILEAAYRWKKKRKVSSDEE